MESRLNYLLIKSRRITAVLCILDWTAPLIAQHSTPYIGEPTVAASFQEAVKEGPASLRVWLQEMPKGGDLHLHLTGAVYAESFIREAAHDRYCVDKISYTLSPSVSASGVSCAEGSVAASTALDNQDLWKAMIDAYSIRDFIPSASHPMRTQFFSTFDRFLSLSGYEHGGEWLAEVTSRAAAQNEQYLEVMHLPATLPILSAGQKLQWKSDSQQDMQRSAAEASEYLPQLETVAEAEISHIEEQRNKLQHCGTEQPEGGCKVHVRWIFSVLRDRTSAEVFLQALVGFALASRDPRIVGVNFLREEDLKNSLDQYHLGMEIIHYLRERYPTVHVTLHAGELAEGIVEPNDLSFHIREAVEIAGAERIGHGVDIAEESNAAGLISEMANRHIMVEINLTSNDLILDSRGHSHPLHKYLDGKVPVALSTDDEGVSRIDLTHEFVKAAVDQSLDYLTLKQMVRNSLEYSFLPGKSLWISPPFGHLHSPCEWNDLIIPGKPCLEFLRSNEKASEQFELEKRFVAFEARHLSH